MSAPRTRVREPVEIDPPPDAEALAGDLQEHLRETCHDMRDPIAAILALAATASMEPGVGAGARRRLDQIATEAEHLALMVRGVLSEDVVVEFNPTRAIAETAAAARSAYDGELEFLGVVNDVQLSGNPTVLRRMLGNLLSNACRAAGRGGRVRVTVTAAAACVTVTVEDDGPGFAGQVAPGLRYGLNIVERYAVRYGGVCSYGSSTLGGALVRLELPAHGRSDQSGEVGRAGRAV
jgi:signal transduction histidine kinase